MSAALAGIERQSPTWSAVTAFLKAEIERARDELERTEPQPGAHDRARGRIELARQMLKATDPPPAIPSVSAPYV